MRTRRIYNSFESYIRTSGLQRRGSRGWAYGTMRDKIISDVAERTNISVLSYLLEHTDKKLKGNVDMLTYLNAYRLVTASLW